MRPLATPSGNSRTNSLPMRKRASAAVSIGSSARASGVGPCRWRAGFKHPLDQMRARRPRLERIGEILGLARDLAVAKLHDAHRIGRPPVIGQNKFGDPEVARADDPPDREALLVRLHGARRLNVAPPTDALARLRIFEHRVLLIDLMLRLEVVGVGRGPVAIQSRANFWSSMPDLLDHRRRN